MSLDAYSALIHVVEQGSVSAAARVLGVPRPTVSRRLARLEERLGERLVRRGPRDVEVTRAGRRLYETVRGPLAAVAAAERELLDRRDEPSGPLRVAIPPALAEPMAGFFRDWRRAWPAVSLEVFTETRFVDLTAEGFDVALRAGVLAPSDWIQRRLLTLPVRAWASAEYLRRHGTPREPEDLARHTLLRGYDANNAARTWWPLRGGGRVAVTGRFCTNDRVLLRAACAAGAGIALLTDLPFVPTDLIPIVPAVGASLRLHVLYPERALMPARVRVFVDAVVESPLWASLTERATPR